MPPLGGPRRNIATTFGMEKLQRCGYLTVKNFGDTFIRFDRIHACDRQKDGWTDIARQRRMCLCIASRGKNAECCKM